jgi:exonuclease SbcD
VSLDYIRAVLFDETDIPDAVAKLRHIYPNIMCMEYDNTRTRNLEKVYQTDDSVREKKEPLDYISELYRIQNGKDMTAEQKKMAVRILESADIKDKESM